MSVVSVKARSFILALFIRDDGERFLLGDKGYEFTEKQLHFAANSIENDEVQKQGADGVLVAGQVRRSAVQSFDGYVGDAANYASEIEQMRRDFIAFFAKNHHFRVIYVDVNKNAWQRKGGYLVDAPEVKELYQIHPEYHVGLNFEDVNYYKYDENAEGEEILANLLNVPLSDATEGGLVWDEDGAASEDAEIEVDGETATASGEFITVDDAVGAPLSSFSLKGNTEQDGTPTPDAPVAVQTVTGENVVRITGKNLLNTHATPASDRLSDAGISYTIADDGTITTSGTSTATYKNICFDITLPAGTYKFSGCPSGGTIDSYSFALQVGSTLYYDYGSGATFTLSGQTTVMAYPVRLGGNTGVDMNGKVFKPMITASTASQDYEAYQEQSYEVNLGKNLLDMSQTFTQGTIDTSGNIVPNNNTVLTDYIAVKGSTSYVLSQVQKTTSKTVKVNIVSYFDTSKTFIGRFQVLTLDPQTFTTPSNCGYIRFGYYTSNGLPIASWLDYVEELQLEQGTRPTPYADYFTPIELCKLGNYQDYIYKSGDDWYVHKETNKILVDGSENWQYPDSGTSYTFFQFSRNNFRSKYGASADFVASNSEVGFAKSDKFVQILGTSAAARLAQGISFSTEGNGWFRISVPNTVATTVDAFKTWLTSNNATVYYALATPTDTQITNQALIEQLEAILAAHAYAGTNNITTVIAAGNAQGELEIEYYTDYNWEIVGGGYIWSDGGSSGPTIVHNESIISVSPVWTVYGPALNPQLENTTTGESIQYVGMVADGQTLTIDMGEQTASLDGLNVVSNIAGSWIDLAVGRNVLVYSAGSSNVPDSEIGWSEIVG